MKLSRTRQSLAVAFTCLVGISLFSTMHNVLGAGITLPEYTTNKLENGMTVLLMERHELPLVSFAWVMKSGASICDPEGREGTASLTAQMLRKGTKTRTADQISEALDFVGASFHADASHISAAGAAEVVSKDIDLGIELLSDLLRNPVFPQDELTKMIKQEVDGIAEAKEVPNQVISLYFRRFLFGDHPYARPSGGTEETLPKITREDVVRFHEQQYVPNQMILAVVGDFKSAEMKAKIAAAFSSWKAGNPAMPSLSDPTPVQGRHALIVEKPDATQTFFRIGAIGLKRTNPDWVPLGVVNTLFGGRFTSMINSALRIESGLTYGARSQFSPSPAAGDFIIGSFTKNETTAKALDLALDVLVRLHEKGISAEQLQSAKSYIKGQFGPQLETNDQLAATIAELEFYGLGADYINTYFDRVDGVTLDEARSLIQKYYPRENFALVLIGQKPVIQPVAAKLATDVQEKAITAPGF